MQYGWTDFTRLSGKDGYVIDRKPGKNDNPLNPKRLTTYARFPFGWVRYLSLNEDKNRSYRKDLIKSAIRELVDRSPEYMSRDTLDELRNLSDEVDILEIASIIHQDHMPAVLKHMAEIIQIKETKPLSAYKVGEAVEAFNKSVFPSKKYQERIIEESVSEDVVQIQEEVRAPISKMSQDVSRAIELAKSKDFGSAGMHLKDAIDKAGSSSNGVNVVCDELKSKFGSLGEQELFNIHTGFRWMAMGEGVVSILAKRMLGFDDAVSIGTEPHQLFITKFTQALEAAVNAVKGNLPHAAAYHLILAANFADWTAVYENLLSRSKEADDADSVHKCLAIAAEKAKAAELAKHPIGRGGTAPIAAEPHRLGLNLSQQAMESLDQVEEELKALPKGKMPTPTFGTKIDDNIDQAVDEVKREVDNLQSRKMTSPSISIAPQQSAPELPREFVENIINAAKNKKPSETGKHLQIAVKFGGTDLVYERLRPILDDIKAQETAIGEKPEIDDIRKCFGVIADRGQGSALGLLAGKLSKFDENRGSNIGLT